VPRWLSLLKHLARRSIAGSIRGRVTLTSERLGRSPDKGDAVIMAWSEGMRAVIRQQKRSARRERERRALAGIGREPPKDSGGGLERARIRHSAH